MTNSTNIDGSQVSNIALMHRETASNIKQQAQYVDEIIADMTAHKNKGDMATAVVNANNVWRGNMQDIYSKLMDMADLVDNAVKQYGSHDSDNASSVATVGQSMSSVGTFLVG